MSGSCLGAHHQLLKPRLNGLLVSLAQLGSLERHTLDRQLRGRVAGQPHCLVLSSQPSAHAPTTHVTAVKALLDIQTLQGRACLMIDVDQSERIEEGAAQRFGTIAAAQELSASKDMRMHIAVPWVLPTQH